MLSKAKIKEIRSLGIKKFRDESGLFVVEGNKIVGDLLSAFDCEWLIAKPSWMATQGDIPAKEILVDEGGDIERISTMKTPQDVLAVFRKPSYSLDNIDTYSQLVLVSDGIQDPGNLGTIIRLADWFGIGNIVCSKDTADAFAPKTVQATMGALAHVKVYYTDITEYLSKQNCQVYGTFLKSENIYKSQLSQNGIIVMGNEGNGIRPETEAFITKRLYIPPYPLNHKTTESLNVAVATAIVCAEFRRRG